MTTARPKDLYKKYAHYVWWGGFGVAAVACVALTASYLLSGGSETDDAMAAGRRLVISLETGEVSGARVGLDGKIIPPKKVEETQDATKNPENPAPADESKPPESKLEESPQPDAAAAGEGATAPEATEAPVEEKTEEKPKAEQPKATPMGGVDQALVEQTPDGELPVIGSDGRKPWRAYSKPFERSRNQPMVAIVITGLGQSREPTENALALHEYFTMSFSPYVRDLASWNAAVRAHGHEVMVDLPLQPTNYPAADPGPQGLIIEKGAAAADKNLRWLMQRFPTSIGFLTPQSEAFTANDDAFKLIIQALSNRGLLLAVSHEPPRKETRDLIDTSQSAILVADVLIDEELSEIAIQTRLSQLEDQAKKHGYAVGVAQAYPITIEQLRLWSQELEKKGVILVPLTAIAKLRFS